jgi:hypothetical protein
MLYVRILVSRNCCEKLISSRYQSLETTTADTVYLFLFREIYFSL